MPGHKQAKCECGAGDWRIWIRIVEARHVMWRGLESRVVTRVGRMVQTTSFRPVSSAPYFGEEFTYVFNVHLEELLDQVVTLSVQETRKMLPRYWVMGSTQLDVCTIWEQPDHQVNRKWAVLTHPTTDTDGPAGFLLVDLAVLGHGDNLRLLPPDQTGSPIEQNLLAPSWAGSIRRCRAHYALRIYFADGLPLRDPPHRPAVTKWPTSTYVPQPELDPVTPVVSVLPTPPNSTPTPPPSPTPPSSPAPSSLTLSKRKRKRKRKLSITSRISVADGDSRQQRPSGGEQTPKELSVASKFLTAFRKRKKISDLEENRRSESESSVEGAQKEEGGELSVPKNIKFAHGQESCGCKARYSARITFAGKVETTAIKGCDHFQPSWCEEILMPEMYPPLYQRMCIQILDSGRVIAQHKFHLNRVTCDVIHHNILGDPKASAHGYSHIHEHAHSLGSVMASFGPAFIYLSGAPLRPHKKPSVAVHNAVHGPQPRGRILIQMRVLCADSHSFEKASKAKKKSCRRKTPQIVKINIAPVRFGDIWRTCQLTLAAVVWDVSLIKRSRLGGRKIGLQVTLGHAGDHLLWQDSHKPEVETMLFQSSLTAPRVEPPHLGRGGAGCPYLHLDFGRDKPVLAVRSKWPWFIPDLRAANHIDRLAHYLSAQLTAAGRLLEQNDPSAGSVLMNAVDTVISVCATILRENEMKRETMKDNESDGTAPPGLSWAAHLRVRGIEETAMSVLQVGVHGLGEVPAGAGTAAGNASQPPGVPSIEIFSRLSSTTTSTIYRKAFSLLGTMHDAIGEIGNSLPEVTVWLIADEKRVAACTMPARWLVAARKHAHRGRYCGRLQAILLRDVTERSFMPSLSLSLSKRSPRCRVKEWGGTVLAKAEIIFWLGVRKKCAAGVRRSLPGGCVRQDGVLPLAYTYVHEHRYKCIVHIYEGRFAPGADRSGLNDPFVRVVFGQHCAQTKVSESTLSPHWRQSLHLPPVHLCGNPGDVQQRPPMVVIEAWDRDRDAWSDEFLGRALIRPRVQLLPDIGGFDQLPSQKVSFHLLSDSTLGLAQNAADLRNNGRPAAAHGYDLPELAENDNDQFVELSNLQWLPMTIGSTRTGDVLAAAELVQMNDVSDTSIQTLFGAPGVISEKKRKRRKKSVPHSETFAIEVSPILRTYRLEILFWGLRDLKRPKSRPPDHQFVVFEIAGSTIKSSRLDPADSLNFPDPYVTQTMTLPADPSLLPAIHIKLFRRQVALLCHQYIATNVIPSLSAFLRLSENQDDSQEAIGSTEVSLLETSSLILNADASGPSDPDTEGSRSSDSEMAPLLPQVDWVARVGRKTSNVSDKILPESTDDPVQKRRRLDMKLLTSVFKFRKASGLTLTPSPEEGVPVRTEPVPEQWDQRNRTQRLGIEIPRNLNKTTKPQVDWWTRYYASLNQTVRRSSEDDVECGFNPLCRRISLKPESVRNDSDHLVENELLLVIYPNELEAQKEFAKFQDFLYTIELHRGKVAFPEDTGASIRKEGRSARATEAALRAAAVAHQGQSGNPDRVIATLKACVRLGLERLPTPTTANQDAREARSELLNLADNGKQQVIVRVYVLRAHALHGRLKQGRADPYLNVTFGRHTWDGRGVRQTKVLDPIFGQCVQFEGEFPTDHRLVVRVMDHVGSISGGHLLGETSIDLENRFYSRHFGGCGLPRRYDRHGANAWRDSRRPSDLLAALCRAHNLPNHVVDLEEGLVRIGKWSIRAPEATLRSSDPRVRTEEIVLSALLSWQHFPSIGRALVPAHVETRSLYHPDRPGVEQGKMEMWVDVIPTGSGGPWSGASSTLVVPPAMNVEPPTPRRWELRVIVLQAVDVVRTEKSIFFRELASDVYVAAWIGGLDVVHKTDVHFRSLDGSALFNWRLVFDLSYVSAEGRIVVGDRRFPPRLHLTLMDYDTFTKDDILGSMTLDLRQVSRPAPRSASDDHDRGVRDEANTQASDQVDGDFSTNAVEIVDLFEARRARGWWPVLAAAAAAGKGREIAGKVELDLELLWEEEAIGDPVGRGRDPPHPLAMPKRPEISISILRHPFVGLYRVVWKRNKMKIIFIFIVFVLIIACIAAFVNLPKYIFRRILGL